MKGPALLIVLGLLLVGAIVLGRGLMTPAPAQPGGVTELTVEGSDFAFDPEEFAVNQGDTVRIILENVGVTPHNWAIPDWDVTSATIEPGEEAVLEFRAQEPGDVEFVCTVPGHRELGMYGTMTVRP